MNQIFDIITKLWQIYQIFELQKNAIIWKFHCCLKCGSLSFYWVWPFSLFPMKLLIRYTKWNLCLQIKKAEKINWIVFQDKLLKIVHITCGYDKKFISNVDCKLRAISRTDTSITALVTLSNTLEDPMVIVFFQKNFKSLIFIFLKLQGKYCNC